MTLWPPFPRFDQIPYFYTNYLFPILASFPPFALVTPYCCKENEGGADCSGCFEAKSRQRGASSLEFPFKNQVNRGVHGRSMVGEEQVVKSSGGGCFYERRTKRHEY